MTRAAAIILALLTLLAAAMTGCRGERTDAPPRRFFPSLDEQQRWDPQAETEFYADARVAREPVAGVVAFGWSPDPEADDRESFLGESDAVYRGVNAGGEYLASAPLAQILENPSDPREIEDLIARGRDRFDIFCASCHGKTGVGDGIVGKRWSYPLPNFHDPQYQPGGEKGQDGYIFHTIRNGVANTGGQQPALRMPAYAERVSERDAWAIVLYVRALQRSRAGSIADVPEAERQRLRQTRGASQQNQNAAGEESPS